MVCTPYEHVTPSRSRIAGDYLPTSTGILWSVSSRLGFASFLSGHCFISVVLTPPGPYLVFICSDLPLRNDVSNIFPGSLAQVSSSLVWNLLLLLTTHSGTPELWGRPQFDQGPPHSHDQSSPLCLPTISTWSQAPIRFKFVFAATKTTVSRD